MNEQLISKLMDTMEDVKERVIRIEEGQKDIRDLKTEVSNQKVTISNIDASTRSAHKRIDTVENEMVTVVEFNALAKRVDKLETGQAWVVKLVLGIVIAAILGLVLIENGGM